MSSDFTTKLSYDQALLVSDSVEIGVFKGASNLTYQSYPSNSTSPSSTNFSVNPPSESVISLRHVLLDMTYNVSIFYGSSTAGAQMPVGTSIWEYGKNQSMQSFPLARSMNTITSTVNNVSSSVSLNQVLPGLLRMLPTEFMQKYDGFTPTYLDNYGNYKDIPAGANNNPMGGQSSSGYNQYLRPRGVHPILESGFSIVRNNAVDNSPISTGLSDYWVVNFSVKLVEPLFSSPFAYGNQKNQPQGYLGINNFQILLNLDPTLSRFWSTSLPDNVPISLKLNSISNANLQFAFLNAPMSLVLPEKAVLPYTSIISYVTNNLTEIPAKVPRVAAPEMTYSINSIQFEVVPDLLLFWARKPLVPSFQNPHTTDTFMALRKISLTFANKSGILANASTEQLWLRSKKNKCCIDWTGFNGSANEAISVDPFLKEIATCGSVLALSPTLDFGLDSVYLSNASVGQFNLQAQITFANHYDVAFDPDIVVAAFRAGVLVTKAGTSLMTTNLLNASIVNDTIEKAGNPTFVHRDERLVGGMDDSDMSGGAYSGGARSAGARGHSNAKKQRSRLAALAI